jgi:hypothetical protein
MNIFRKIWLWLKGNRIKNTGYDLLKVTGTDFIHITYSWERSSGLPDHIDITPAPLGALLIGPFPKRMFGKTLYVDAGKNKVEHIDMKYSDTRPKK